MPLQNGSGSVKSQKSERSSSTKSQTRHLRDGSIKSSKFPRDGSSRSTRTPRNSIVNVDGPLHRRPMISRSPGSFRRVAIYHLISGFIAVCCQITVTVLVTKIDESVIFHVESPSASGVAKASLGIVSGTIYLFLGLYGFYLARNLFTFPSDVLRDKLWCFNVLNGLSIVASLMLFGASSFLAKSSAAWYDEVEGSVAASTVLAMSLILTVISCFEICVGASGVFVK